MIKELVAKMELGNGTVPKQGKKPSQWSAEEDAILRKYFPTHGSKKVTELTGRTRKAISNRCAVLGVKSADPQRNWTKEEDDQIRANYELHGGNWLAERLNRSPIAVRSRAATLGVKADKSARAVERKRKAMEKAREARQAQFRVAPRAKEPTFKIKALERLGPDIITAETKVTIATPFVDRRWVPERIERVVDPGQCREWAKVAR